jgi:hypothetical protein
VSRVIVDAQARQERGTHEQPQRFGPTIASRTETLERRATEIVFDLLKRHFRYRDGHTPR